jgi:hypothetical protein
MTWFTENPMPLVLIGTIVAAALAVVLTRTGRREALWGLIAVVGLVAVAVTAERMIITPREEVRTALDEIRALVAANKPADLLTRIDVNPNDQELNTLRRRVQDDLARVTVTEAKITELRDEDILVSESGNTAKTKFSGAVSISGGGQAGVAGSFPFRFEVDLRKKDGVWVITSAKYGSALPGAAGQAAQPIQ